ncbi:MAG: LytR C-terminal domain-containing protein, partial [Actinomycetota bacterium]|nr:LytR C-terminal domain-containing protein [Actinomycetota bacterium]
LAVRNGTSRGGLAAVAADALRSRGFAIASIDNADRNDLRRTLIRYPRQRREEARLVAKLFAGARLVRAQPGEPLTVLMGADADVTRLQRVAARPAPAVALEPEPAPTYKGAVPAPNRDC